MLARVRTKFHIFGRYLLDTSLVVRKRGETLCVRMKIA